MNTLATAIRLFLFLTFVTGALYPLLITGIAQVAFPRQANGSMIVEGGKVCGSELIGQRFDAPQYFWSRPSALAPSSVGTTSGGSNIGPTNRALRDAIESRILALRRFDPGSNRRIPTELVTASASGLDPHLSLEAAKYQVPRVARFRGVSEARLLELVQQHTQGPQFGVLGEPVVNVLQLNLALDREGYGEARG